MKQIFQAKINEELQANGVEIYHFPTDDETVQEINNSMNTHVPFAVVGSTEFVKLGSKMIRARQYPWVSLEISLKSTFLRFACAVSGHRSSRERSSLRLCEAARNADPNQHGGHAREDSHSPL